NFNETDDDFEDRGERFLFEVRDKDSKSGNKTIDVPISIPVPNSAEQGIARMRIGFIEGVGKNFTSCDFKYDAGEVEDYNINLTSTLGTNPDTKPGTEGSQPAFCQPSNVGTFNVNYISNVAIG